MSKCKSEYKEELLQWIWENRKFRQTGLNHLYGSSLKVLNPGTRNTGNGPDFSGAKLRIDDLLWNGNIEIHTHEASWYTHNHHLDPGYNSVILHVVFHLAKNGVRAMRQDGTQPATFHIAPALENDLHQLLAEKQKHGIECSGKISFINQEAFRKQVQKANKEYFDYKANELMNHFNPRDVPSEAWKKMLIISLYSSLGIPRNRHPMETLALKLIGRFHKSSPDSAQVIENFAQKIAFHDDPGITWLSGGMRPASYPSVRVKQASALQYVIMKTPVSMILDSGTESWDLWRSEITKSHRTGEQTDTLLKLTVFYPAIYLLGKLFHSEKLVRTSFTEWENGSITIPSKILKSFENAGFQTDSLHNNPGLIHQYKRYCTEKNCTGCGVFKKAILS
ncbi:MAG: DUF2851 family protein [Balneolaceae bacterium]